ncbi:MAG: NADH-quinone oxidoreductase subunit N [Deltaproteobacteria bacterium]|nr:NADH-quinone oxidoreductase subunit N [Deltaproteobacteria bacterium]
MKLEILSLLPGIPLTILLITAVIVLLWQLLKQEGMALLFACVGIMLAALMVYAPAVRELGRTDYFHNDGYSALFGVAVLLGLLLTILLNHGQYAKQGLKLSGDMLAILLLGTCGGLSLFLAKDYITFYLSLEILALSSYILTAAARESRLATEAAIKYFVIGAFGSGFILLGIVFMYGASGSLQMYGALEMSNPFALLGLGLMLFGFAFKVGLVPFHFWLPDVYQGAPTGMVAFLSGVAKIAFFFSFARFFMNYYVEGMKMAFYAVSAVAVLSMTLGNILALRQERLKRLLAYSSIAHGGYMMLGYLVAGQGLGFVGMMFYGLSYLLMTILSFGLVLLMGEEGEDGDLISKWQNIGKRCPRRALVMTIALLSLAGIPPFLGFMAKYNILFALINMGQLWLLAIAILNSVIALYYYLKVIVVMYFGDEEYKGEVSSFQLLPSIAIGALTVLIVVSGIMPQWLYNLCLTTIKQ